MEFHPVHQILASGSRDYSIKFYEYSKPSVKKAYKSIQVVSTSFYVSCYGLVTCHICRQLLLFVTTVTCTAD